MIHFLELGEDAPGRLPVLFLHGWGLDAATFLPALHLLARDRKVYALDLPGFGRTKCRVRHWTYAELAGILLDWMDDLGIEKAHLMGHSLGAGICLEMGSRAPQRAGSLLLVDSSGIPFGSYYNLVIARSFELTGQFIAQAILAPRYFFRYVHSQLYNFLFNPITIIRAADLPLYGDLQPVAERLDRPVLLVWGERDRTIPLEMGIRLSQHLKNGRLLVVRGRYYHEWSILYPAKFAQIAQDFLAEVGAGS